MPASSQPTPLQVVLRSVTSPSPAYNLFRFQYWFGQVDARPLSLFRIVFALLLAKDVIYSFSLVGIFYTAEGIVPRWVLQGGLTRETRFSPLDAVGDAWMIHVFLAAWLLVLLLMAIGWHTRIMTILNALMVVAFQERNLFVLNGADTVFRVMSIWCVFMSLGACWSVDAVRARLRRYRQTRKPSDLRAPDTPPTAWALPLRAAQVQVAVIYFFTGLLKVVDPSSLWLKGLALDRTLQLLSLTLPPGDWFLKVAPGWLMTWLDYQTLFLELGFVVLVFSPILQPYLRLLGLGLGVMLHGGILVMMSIANFPLLMIATYFLFVEGSWLNWLRSRLPHRPHPLTLATPPARSPLWTLLAATTRSAIALDATSRSTDAKRDDWQVVDAAGAPATGVAAWKQAVSSLPLNRAWSPLLGVRAVRATAWRLMGLASRAALPDPAEGSPKPHLVSRQAAAVRSLGKVLVGTCVIVMMSSVVRYELAATKIHDKRLIKPIKRWEGWILLQTGLWQTWAMFAPSPANRDGWVVVRGTFEDGRVLDLRTDEPESNDMYRVFWGPDGRWKKFESELIDKPRAPLLQAWSDHYCNKWAKKGLPAGQRLVRIEIVFRGFFTHERGQDPNPWQEWSLSTQECLTGEANAAAPGL